MGKQHIGLLWMGVVALTGCDPKVDEETGAAGSDGAGDETALDSGVAWDSGVVWDSGAVSDDTESPGDGLVTDAGLYVVLEWDTDNSDLDLHLASGDATLFEEPLDVNFCNPSADWGEPGEAVDDPALLVDDLIGFGPEVITIEAPAEGAYRVRVHFFAAAPETPAGATVYVYLDGELVHAASAELSKNDVWDVGEIRFPEGAFATTGTLSEATESTCYTP